jgi:drug/metabolite transporter (DMT)-like permease
VLGCTFAQALQIVLVERYASRYDAVALVFVEMVTCFCVFAVLALAAGEIALPRGGTVWSALLVTGLFASAFGFLVQVWAQRRLSAARIALVFALESPFAGLSGYLLDHDRLSLAGWTGCALILAGIVLAEPAAATVLGQLVRRPRTV